MKITRKNYEGFFLDYSENNLSQAQVAELFIFLDQNPDLKEEFESFENLKLVADMNMRFGQKKALKKNELIPTDNIHGGNYNEFIVADLEGDLSEDESIEIKAFISLNPKTKLDYNIYRSTFLKPDMAILFEGKEKLKKTGIFVIYRRELIAGLSIAASVILLLGIYFGFLEKPEQRKFAGKIERLNPIMFDKGSNQNIASGENNFLRKIESRKTISVRSSGANSTEKLDMPLLPQIAGLHPRPAVPVEMDQTEIAMARLDLRNTSFAFDINDFKTPGQKSFASRFIAGLASKVIKIEIPKRKSFLEYTIEGYNLMADKEVTLEKKWDENGKIIAYSLNGQNISFSRNRNQSKN